jgi:hypothetical protein
MPTFFDPEINLLMLLLFTRVPWRMIVEMLRLTSEKEYACRCRTWKGLLLIVLLKLLSWTQRMRVP